MCTNCIPKSAYFQLYKSSHPQSVIGHSSSCGWFQTFESACIVRVTSELSIGLPGSPLALDFCIGGESNPSPWGSIPHLRKSPELGGSLADRWKALKLLSQCRLIQMFGINHMRMNVLWLIVDVNSYRVGSTRTLECSWCTCMALTPDFSCPLISLTDRILTCMP